MKSLMLLLEKILEDSSIRCNVSTTRDLKTILSRSKDEGLSFLTITLPSFCSDFERSLDQKKICEHTFLGFKKNKALPAFLQGFLSLVFDHRTGVIHDSVSIDAIFCIRQICLMFKKFRAECTNARQRNTLEQFVLTDLAVSESDLVRTESQEEAFHNAFLFLFNPCLKPLEKLLSSQRNLVVPKHGPGATADRTLSNDKFNYLTWTKRLESLFPSSDFLLPNGNFESRREKIKLLDPRHEPPVRVVLVPKTLKTPRIIAIEPVHMQYVQQGLLELLVPALESRIMYDSLGFTDQVPNQELARKGSLDGTYSTLDLSEASDRVSNQLVELAFSNYPTLSKMVQACRSRSADVPGFGVIPLSKFASMGSALCFPIEAMVFLTIIFLGYTKREWHYNDYKLRKRFLQSVRVYGDDLIIPIHKTLDVVSELSSFHMKVNQRKSFWTGEFRESCGGDYFRGEPVKPIYLKGDIPTSHRQVDEVTWITSFRNQLYYSGFWKTCSLIDNMIKRFAPFPHVSPSSQVLGRETYLPLVGDRMCTNLHRPLVRGLVRVSKPPPSPLDDAGALLKFFLKRGDKPFESKDHLKSDGRPKFAALKLRWALL